MKIANSKGLYEIHFGPCGGGEYLFLHFHIYLFHAEVLGHKIKMQNSHHPENLIC